jgi:hypothetical protein
MWKPDWMMNQEEKAKAAKLNAIKSKVAQMAKAKQAQIDKAAKDARAKVALENKAKAMPVKKKTKKKKGSYSPTIGGAAQALRDRKKLIEESMFE